MRSNGPRLASLVIAIVSVSVMGIVIVKATGSPSQAAAPAPLDVMTFNIRTANGRDGDNAWPHRKALVVETIQRFAPHVAGLQEALDEQIEYLAAALPDYRWIGIDRGLNGGTGLSEYTPIFYRHAELSPIESGNFWLSSTPDRPTRRRRGSRIVTWAKFHHHATDRPLYVFNTHFTLRRGQRQLDSAAMITARLDGLPPDAAVVVTGDFNNVAEVSDTWRAFTSQGLRDAWVVADERFGPPITSNGFGPPRDGRVNRIDWILVGGPIAVCSVETVLHNDAGRYPSDHYPVAARLDLQY